jgi:hypothetical protein
MLEDYPKTIILKDHTECIFKIASRDDKNGIIAFFRRISPDDLWVLKRDYTDKDCVDFFINSINPFENIHLLACVKDIVIGMGSIYYTRFGARKHIGEVEVIIDESWKKKRVGSWIMLELAGMASFLKLDLLKIELIAGKDDPAIITSRRLNFIPQATLKNYLKDRNGKWVDLVILVKEISESWSDY